MKHTLLIAIVAGCGGYNAGTFRDLQGPFGGMNGSTATVGCVEVGVSAMHDSAAGGPVIAYGFGNRCPRAVTLDLKSVRAVGRDAEGHEVALATFDPRDEIRPLPLDGLYSGHENIEYDAPEGSPPIANVCVDIGRIDASEQRGEQWVCTSFPVQEASR